MLDGIYNLTLRSQLGPRAGTLIVAHREEQLWGSLDILGFENKFTDGTDCDGQFSICMEIKTLLGVRSITVQGQCDEIDTLTGTVQMEQMQMPFTAQRKEQQTVPTLF